MFADLRCRVISGANRVASGEADGTSYPTNPARVMKEMSTCMRHTCKAYLSEKILLWNHRRNYPQIWEGTKITENPIARWQKWKSITEVHSKLLNFSFLYFELLLPFYINCFLINVFRSSRLDHP